MTQLLERDSALIAMIKMEMNLLSERAHKKLKRWISVNFLEREVVILFQTTAFNFIRYLSFLNRAELRAKSHKKTINVQKSPDLSKRRSTT